MQLFYYVLLMVTSLLWAGNFVAGKFLVGHASSLTLTDLRWGIAVLFLLPLVWFREKKIFPPREALLSLFLMGLTGVVLFNIFMFLALERTTADNVGLLSALNPVAIAIASYFILQEKLGFRQLAGMVISLLGVVVVISHGEWERIVQFQLNAGDLYMLAAVATWGLYSVAGRRAMRFVSPFMSTMWAGIFGVLMILPFNLPSLAIKAPDTGFWIALLYVGIGATVIAMVLWNIGVQQVGGTKSGMFLNFNPIFTAVLAFWLIGETFSIVQAVGTSLVILGVYLFTVQRKAVPATGQGQTA